MKKTFLSKFMKPVLFLSLVMSAVNVQPLSAQTTPSVTSNSTDKPVKEATTTTGNQDSNKQSGEAHSIATPDKENNEHKNENTNTANAKQNTINAADTDVEPSNPESQPEKVTTQATPTTNDKEVKTSEVKKEEKPVKPVRKEPVYHEDSKALKDYNSTSSIRESRVVRFHYDEGLNVDKVVFVTAGDKLDANQIPQPTKQGYEFLGWYYKESDAYKFAPRAVKEELLPFDFNQSIYLDFDLYAKWKKVEVVNVPQVVNKKPVPNTADC